MRRYSTKLNLVFALLIVSAWFTSCKKTDTASPLPPQKPVAGFGFVIKGQGTLPDTVVFTNSSSNASSYFWTFDDGNSSTLQNPSNIYSTAKTFNVKLVVTGSGGTDSITQAVSISLDKPKVDFSFTILNDGSLPTQVVFTSNTIRADSVLWNFDDGNTSKLTNPQNDYKVSKTYNVKLIAFNSAGKDSLAKPVTVTINKPTAGFNYINPNTGQVPSKVSFTNTSKNAETYQWLFGDGNTSTAASPENTFTKSITYSVKLVVTNSSGKDSFSRQVTIPPINQSVRVFLITPTDKPFNQAYYNILKATALHIQAFYKSQMGGKTFTLNDPVVDTLKGLHNYAWYNSDNGAATSGTDPRFYGYYNTVNEISKLITTNTNLYTYIFYVAAPGGGAGATGQAALGDQDLDGLLSEQTSTTKRWIGGSAHEWGHAFGLPHPDNQLGSALMWTGYATYPNCILQQVDKDILNVSKFFK